MCALRGKGSKKMPLYWNVSPGDMHDKFLLLVDCKFRDYTQLGVLDQSHSCRIVQRDRCHTLMRHQDCIFHLGISVWRKQDRKLLGRTLNTNHESSLNILTFESVEEILWYDHSNESSLTALPHGTICFSACCKLKCSIVFNFDPDHF